MSNIASILKSEIARVARKEVRGETLGLKRAVSAYRAEIVALGLFQYGHWRAHVDED